MPHISISLYAGKSPEEKQAIAEKIHQATVQELGYKPESVSVSVTEYAPDEFSPSMRNQVKKDELLIPSTAVF